MAAGRHKAIIEIEAKVSQADKKLKKLESQVAKLTKQLEKSGKASKASIVNLDRLKTVATAWASIEGIRRVDQLVQESVKYENVMANLPFSIDKARKSTKDLISDFDLAKSAVAANALGITQNSEQFAKFSEAAVKLGSKLGIDTPAAMEQLTAAVGRGSAKILDNFGIMAKGFESMSMEERLNLISEAADDTTLVVSQSAQEWNKLKNTLDALARESMPAVVDALGFITEGLVEATKLQKEFKDASVSAMLEAGVSLDEIAEAERRVAEEQANLPWYTAEGLASLVFYNQGVEEVATNFTMVERATIAANAALDRFNEKEKKAFAKVQSLIVGSGTQAGRDAAIISAGQKAVAAANESIAGSKKKVGGRGGRGGGPTGPVGPAGSRFDTSSLHGLDLGAQDAENVAAANAGSLEREIELMRLQQEVAAQGAQSEAEIHSMKMAALEETFDAEMRLAELRGDEHGQQVLRLQKEMELANEQARHSDALAKMEAKRTAERIQHQQQVLRAVEQVGNGLIDTASAVTNAMGLEGEKQARAEGIIQGTRSMFIGGLEMVKAVSSFAGFNYIEGAMHLAAATFAFVQGGLMMSGTPPKGGGAGGASAGMGQQFTGGNAFHTQGPSSNIPASPNGTAPSGTQGGGQTGQTNHVNVTVNQTGAIDEDSAMKIKQGLEDLDLSRGNVNS